MQFFFLSASILHIPQLCLFYHLSFPHLALPHPRYFSITMACNVPAVLICLTAGSPARPVPRTRARSWEMRLLLSHR